MKIFEDGSGFQTYPMASVKPSFEVSEGVAARIVAGDPWRLSATAGAVEFLTPEEIAEQEYQEQASKARAVRDARLAATDVSVLPDYPISQPDREAVISYRQALRVWPETAGFPDITTIPESPL